jgi:hypothetical protein|tara:strand:+ start:5334 stop:5753 length:420 start_codon:yes stop_codon:yes gene_type:complete
MKIPELSCNVEVFCLINPSEDLQKIKTAILNIFPDIEIKNTNMEITGTSKKIESLSKIFEVVHNRRITNTYRRILNQNLSNNSTWFFLNRQAAYVDVVALCNEEDESPLGPIEIVLDSDQIEQVIDWLTSYTDDSRLIP